MKNQIEELKKLIEGSKKIVFFTGAGISTLSGIPDFRSKDGIYNQEYKYPPEEILSHTFFLLKTGEFYKFYREKMLLLDKKPNIAHYYISSLEDKKEVAVITQNIDGLHTLAKSKDVIELHGSIHRNYCMKCHKEFDASYIKNYKYQIPLCDECKNIIKPDVVLYEEGLKMNDIERSIQKIEECDLLVVIGTSLKVFPANSLLTYRKGKLVIINKSTTDYDNKADLLVNEDIKDVFENL